MTDMRAKQRVCWAFNPKNNTVIEGSLLQNIATFTNFQPEQQDITTAI